MLTFLSAVTFRSLSLVIFCCIFFFQNNCKQEKASSISTKHNGNGSIENSNSQKSEAKNPSLFCPEGNAFFVLYYGNPLNNSSDGERIRNLKPNFVIVADSLYSDDKVPAYFHYDKDGKPTNIRVIAYIASHYGKGSLQELYDRINVSIQQAKYDGVFFDQVEDKENEHSPTQAQLIEYYSNLARTVKSSGSNKLVIFNPGKKRVEKWIFDYADIVSVENNGIEKGLFEQPFTTNPAEKYPRWRWLSVLGDPSKYAAKNVEEANQRLKSFRHNGGLWFYSPPYCEDSKICPDNSSHYLLLNKLEEFAAEAKKEIVKCNQ
jgi:hypothetical protein